MRIAILGWGSLLWEDRPEFDAQHEARLPDGPTLALEFSRISTTRSGALTLVIDEKNGSPCCVAYAFSNRQVLDEAISDLRRREGCAARAIGYLLCLDGKRHSRDEKSLASIHAWVNDMKIDAVIWTDPESNFEAKVGKPFSIENAIEHIQSLDAAAKAIAAKYVWRAPDFIDTPLRRLLQVGPWFSEVSPRKAS
jgi:hypothetical protein